MLSAAARRDLTNLKLICMLLLLLLLLLLLASLKMSPAMQDDLDETRDAFIQKFSEEPKRDDLTLLAPKQEDPTDQVGLYSQCLAERHWKHCTGKHCIGNM